MLTSAGVMAANHEVFTTGRARVVLDLKDDVVRNWAIVPGGRQTIRHNIQRRSL